MPDARLNPMERRGCDPLAAIPSWIEDFSPLEGLGDTGVYLLGPSLSRPCHCSPKEVSLLTTATTTTTAANNQQGKKNISLLLVAGLCHLLRLNQQETTIG